jgi:hypothetical protein
VDCPELLDAASVGDVAEVRNLEEGCNPDIRDDGGSSHHMQPFISIFPTS